MIHELTLFSVLPFCLQPELWYSWLTARVQGECLLLVYSRAGGCLKEDGNGNLGNFTTHITAATILPVANKFHSGQNIEISVSKNKFTDQLLLEMKALSGIVLVPKQILKPQILKF